MNKSPGFTSLVLFFVVFILAPISCLDRLTFYHKGYKPVANKKLRYDGYYISFEKEPWEIPIGPDQTEVWPNPITPQFFCSDGSFAQYSTHKDELHLLRTFTVYQGKPVSWGVFQTSNDTLIVETLVYNSGTMRRERMTRKAKILVDTLIYFQWQDRKGKTTSYNDTLYFRRFAHSPDTTLNYIKKLKKYNK